MRPDAKGAFLFLLLCSAAIPAALGQGKRETSNRIYQVNPEDSDLQQKANGPRPLTMSDGLAILGAALDSRHHADFPSDCSHFVHQLYERAGFPYEYASSSELYEGVDAFRRVTSPQPGDLAVWRGHAGIVVNPVQHTFFSLLRSGTGVGSYDSPYWKHRGRPRFFRYVKTVPNGAIPKSIQTVSLRPTGLGNEQSGEPSAGDQAADVMEDSSKEAGPSVKLAEDQPEETTTPPVPVVNSVRPNPDQVVAAFLRTCTDSEESLRGRDFFNSAQSLIVFDHFEVRKVHIDGTQDWVEVQIDELVSFTRSKADVHKRSERQRWSLSRRDNTSWELTPSRDITYVPQHVAVRILARELAQLTEDSADTASRIQEKAQLARLLHALLEE